MTVVFASLLGTLLSEPAAAQSALGRTPNTRASWTSAPGAVFVFAHRFEFLAGGDEMLNVPTLTLGSSISSRFAVGLDFSSNSELVAEKLGQNETQYWLAASLVERPRGRLGSTIAYNTAAGSVDGALTAVVRASGISLVAEGRAFSDALATGSAGFAGTLGAVLHLTPYLELSGDVGQLLDPDTLDRAWSAGIGIAIPGTPHTFSINASNGGAQTLQGVSRPKDLGPESVRYGFAFSAPLGSRTQWARVFRRATPEPSDVRDTTVVRVAIRAVAYAPREIRIRVGQTVEWRNEDPVVHTVTGDDEKWGSGFLAEGGTYRQTFAAAGRYPYHCQPHPQMKAVVIVEP
jgi:plastocyanin